MIRHLAKISPPLWVLAFAINFAGPVVFAETFFHNTVYSTFIYFLCKGFIESRRSGATGEDGIQLQ